MHSFSQECLYFNRKSYFNPKERIANGGLPIVIHEQERMGSASRYMSNQTTHMATTPIITNVRTSSQEVKNTPILCLLLMSLKLWVLTVPPPTATALLLSFIPEHLQFHLSCP